MNAKAEGVTPPRDLNCGARPEGVGRSNYRARKANQSHAYPTDWTDISEGENGVLRDLQ